MDWFSSVLVEPTVNPNIVLWKPWFTTYSVAQTQQAMVWEAFSSSPLPDPSRASLELSMVLETSSAFPFWSGHHHFLIKWQSVNIFILSSWTVEDPLASDLHPHQWRSPWIMNEVSNYHPLSSGHLLFSIVALPFFKVDTSIWVGQHPNFKAQIVIKVKGRSTF